jgi:hypothetical protein
VPSHAGETIGPGLLRSILSRTAATPSWDCLTRCQAGSFHGLNGYVTCADVRGADSPSMRMSCPWWDVRAAAVTIAVDTRPRRSPAG